MTREASERIRALVDPLLTAAGLELWDVEVSRGVVRFLVDRPGGIDLDGLTRASGTLSHLLDEHPELAPQGRYQLEVSSPGVERTLRSPDQYRKFVGQEVTVKTVVPVEGSRRHRGVLADAGDASIALEPAPGSSPAADKPGRRIELRYEQIERARTVLVWGPQQSRPAPGRRRSQPQGQRT